jgi:mannose-6-phosphate isomerase-like protein (cupin superfamily)
MDEVGRFDATKGPWIVGPRDGASVDLGSISARFLVWGEESGGGSSLVEHPIPPRTLAAPIHRHSREDEYSYVLEGRLGALLGDDVVYAEPGDLAFKPRDQSHLLERRRYRVPDPRDHLAGDVRALLRGIPVGSCRTTGARGDLRSRGRCGSGTGLVRGARTTVPAVGDVSLGTWAAATSQRVH